MRKIFLALTIFVCAASFAQIKNGTIVYERKINMHRRMQNDEMKAMVPEFRTSKHQLLFSDSVSIYKPVPEDNTPDPFEGGGNGGVVIRMAGPGDNGELYKNFTECKIVESRELGAKTYLIEDSIRQQPWKLTEETATVLKYQCKKATRTNDRGQIINAWYTDAIPCPAGPENFGSLPGVILKTDTNNGEIVFTASSVSDKVKTADIKEPKKGKKTTRDEFNKMMQDMMGNPGPGGRMIRIN